MVKRLIEAGITDFVEEYEVRDENGVFIARGDAAFVEDRTLLEGDGRRNHSSTLDFDADLLRRNRLTAAGWATVHATWRDVRHDPEQWLALVRATRQRQRRLLRALLAEGFPPP